ncbi:hypothetical protein PEL8287_03722 [Roseovarius litorisediminis]|uniref:Uncharacterized protein n=1 Tax=Roseovarius litorisediminis TaxID=1312363 RepID=A0A1Y5TMH9_9RHOB|nr:hypothetical protein PEL8287_03722 [Roseovarius litorisediminis]
MGLMPQLCVIAAEPGLSATANPMIRFAPQLVQRAVDEFSGDAFA